MLGEQNIRPVTVLASADLSASQFCFVDLDNNGNLVLPAAGAAAVGVLQDKPNGLGQAAELVPTGDGAVSKAVAGAALNAGAQVMVTTAGQVITATTGNFVVGRALGAAAASGQLIAVLLVGPYKI